MRDDKTGALVLRIAAREAFKRGHHQRVALLLRKAWCRYPMGETESESLTRHVYLFADMHEPTS